MSIRGAVPLVVMLAGPALAAPAVAQRAREPDVDSLAALVRVDSNDAQLQYAVARALWKKKRFDEAERALREAARVDPQFADAYLALAVLPSARGESYWRDRERRDGKEAVRQLFLDADRSYRRAFVLNPLVDLGVLGRVEERSGVPVGIYVVRFWWVKPFLQGMNEVREGRYGPAFDRLDKLKRDKRAGDRGVELPDGALVYHGLAAAHLGRWDDAIEDFAVLTGRAVAEAKTDEVVGMPLRANDYRYALALMLRLGGKFEHAIAVFRRALEFDAGLYPVHMQLAQIYEAAGRSDDAIAARRAAMDANPDDPSLVLDLGATLARAGRLDDSREMLASAERANPRAARAPYLLGLVASQAADSAAARAAFTRFLAVAPRSMADQIADAKQRLIALP